MRCSVFTRRLSVLGVAATIGASAAMIAGTAQATLTWYDGFAIGADDGAGPDYVAGNLDGQVGGSDAGAGVGFFDNGSGDPNPWVGVNNTDPLADDGAVIAGSLTRLDPSKQSKPSTGDSVDSGEAIFGGCCYTSRVSRDFNTPLQEMNGQVYMGFLVNYGAGNPADPHYRSVEFWNGKNVQPPPMVGDPPGTGDGRVGDDVLTMSLGFSSFGNYDDPVNDADGPAPDPNDGMPPNVTANRQLSLSVTGITELFGSPVTTHYQLGEHLEYASQLGQTHSIVLKFDLSTASVESGDEGGGDTISVFLDPTLSDVTEPLVPSLVVSGIDLNMDAMSSLIQFTFTGGTPNAGAFDELRVATSFAGAGGAGGDVNNTLWSEVAILTAPEPASLSLVALGALGMLATARRKRG
jgi:hypothetical protein